MGRCIPAPRPHRRRLAVGRCRAEAQRTPAGVDLVSEGEATASTGLEIAVQAIELYGGSMVEPRGVEPLTSTLRT